MKKNTTKRFKEILTTFHVGLLRWYKKNKRNLPWRETNSPFIIWISEIMLQQTRVETVVPYFQRFISLFPNVQTLAKADLQDVLKAWEGLGYYSRVRNMHRAAKIITDKFDGHFPSSFEDIIQLPGIGRYTAGAIGSIAFRIAVPVVDGNVIRVLSRIFEIKEDITLAKTKNQFWQLAEQLVPPTSPGDFNQAIMELGATVCLPRNPLCTNCPLSSVCRANIKNCQTAFPVKKPKSPIPHHRIGAGLIWRNGELLITRRPETGLLGGLWEFPGGKQEKGETVEECVKREIVEELGIKIDVKQHFLNVKHAYSHFRITLDIFHCQWISGEPTCKACSDFRWVKISQLDDFPFPKANKRIVEKLMEDIHSIQR
jgi:A/G-specific adenine glycosylase